LPHLVLETGAAPANLEDAGVIALGRWTCESRHASTWRTQAPNGAAGKLRHCQAALAPSNDADR
jgi:hypothetical protein